MKQQTSNQPYKTFFLVAVAVLVLVVAKTVVAGTQCAVISIEKTTSREAVVKGGILERVVSEIEDLPWQPLIFIL